MRENRRDVDMTRQRDEDNLARLRPKWSYRKGAEGNCPDGLSFFPVNGAKGLLGKLLVETRYEIRKFGSRRRDSLNGAQARGAQVFGCSDTRRDFGDDLRGRRIL